MNNACVPRWGAKGKPILKGGEQVQYSIMIDTIQRTLPAGNRITVIMPVDHISPE